MSLPTILLLDLDKTLVNSEDYTDYCAAVDEVRAWLGGELPQREGPATDWGRCALQAMEILVAMSGSERWTEASATIEAFEHRAVETSAAMPGLVEFLAATASCRRAVVTLVGQSAAEAIVRRHGIATDAVVGRRPELRPKPHPDQVVAALAALGADAKSAAMIGDSSWDEAAARAAGVRFVGVSNRKPTSQFPDGVPVAADLFEVMDLLGANS